MHFDGYNKFKHKGREGAVAGLQDALSLPNLVGPRRAGSTAPTVNIPPDAALPTEKPTQPVPARAAPAPVATAGGSEVAEEPAGWRFFTR